MLIAIFLRMIVCGSNVAVAFSRRPWSLRLPMPVNWKTTASGFACELFSKVRLQQGRRLKVTATILATTPPRPSYGL